MSTLYVVWVRQRHPALEARFAPMEWAQLWHAGLQPEPPCSGQQEEEA